MALLFKVTRREPVLISPATTTPHEYKPLSDIDDQQALRHHSAPVLAFFRYNRLMDGKDPVQVIREAVAKTLVYYYPFAGRLREVEQHGVIMKKMIVDCTGEGVMFTEADADISLDEFGEDGIRPPFRCLDQLLFDAPGSLDLLHSPLMLIQVLLNHKSNLRMRAISPTISALLSDPFRSSIYRQMGSLQKETFKPLEASNFAEESHKVIDFLANYYKNIESYPVRSQVVPGYLHNHVPDSAPILPESLQAILDDVEKNIMPGLTHWQSPNFFAYVPINASTASFLGEMLCTGFNVVGFDWINSPADTELEMIVTDWMGKLLKLPKSLLFSGTGGSVIHGSTCEAVVCVLAAARDNALNKIGDENINRLVVYTSDKTHSTVQKATKIVGIPSKNFRIIPTFASASYALCPNDVRVAMEKDLADGLVPLFLCATVGTTTCNASDPIDGLCNVAKKFDVWVHVDAAYIGSACICPEYRHLLDGVEYVDSISMNPHKWFLSAMDCCCLWLKEPKLLIECLGSDPEYLKNDLEGVVAYKDWQISLARRFRALKLWIVLRRYGVANLMDHIRSDIEMAKHFEGLVRGDKRFEVVVERKFALTCFRLRDTLGSYDVLELNKKLLEEVNSSGRAYMSHGVVGGVFVIRCAVGGTMTEKIHVDGLWKLIQEKTDLLLSETPKNVL